MKRRSTSHSTSHSTSLSAWCPDCASNVRMLTPDEAGLLAGVTTRTIYRRAEDGRVHFTETPEGALLVCSNSASQTD